MKNILITLAAVVTLTSVASVSQAKVYAQCSGNLQGEFMEFVPENCQITKSTDDVEVVRKAAKNMRVKRNIEKLSEQASQRADKHAMKAI